MKDFYYDWALAQFGEKTAASMVKLFSRLDGNSLVNDVGARLANLPRPSDWKHGPGGFFPDSRPWKDVGKEYNFIHEMERVRPKVKGEGNLERFDYWLNNFRYMKAMGKFNCTLYQFNREMEKVRNEKNSKSRKKMAREFVLPIKKQQIAELREIHKYLGATIKTTGGMGMAANWQQHNIPLHIEKPGKELADILGEELPEDALPTKEYPGDA